jgi:hypothetical protein
MHLIKSMANITINERLKQRFLKFVDNPEDFGINDVCCIWNGNKTADGYGLFTLSKKEWRAHRMAYFIHHNGIDDNMLACHRCPGHRNCVNPLHIYMGTAKDNIADCLRDGTHRSNFKKGEEHCQAKLNDEKVLEIRRRLLAGEKAKVLAAEYGVTKSSIYLIKSGKQWNHI